MASALNSVTPTSYFNMSSLSLRASVSQMKRGDELSSTDLLASPQVKKLRVRLPPLLFCGVSEDLWSRQNGDSGGDDENANGRAEEKRLSIQ